MSDLPCGGAERHVRALQRLGWQVARKTGSHVVLTKAGNPATLSIPDHRGRDVSRKLLARVLKHAGITEGEYLDAYR
jgi:predicted RNA binding protein YcfA (HicA-like mRNA interferase family)